jgi:hypothetical protein
MALCTAAVGPTIEESEEGAQDNAAVLYVLTIEHSTSLHRASALRSPLPMPTRDLKACVHERILSLLPNVPTTSVCT